MQGNEDDTNYFGKKEIKQAPYYVEKKTKEDFQKICSRLNSSCNKEICIFINEFNLKHKEVLNSKRID